MDQGAELPVIKQLAKAGEHAQAYVLHPRVHAVGQHQLAVSGHAGLPAAVQRDVLPPHIQRATTHGETLAGTQKKRPERTRSMRDFYGNIINNSETIMGSIV